MTLPARCHPAPAAFTGTAPPRRDDRPGAAARSLRTPARASAAGTRPPTATRALATGEAGPAIPRGAGATGRRGRARTGRRAVI